MYGYRSLVILILLSAVVGCGTDRNAFTLPAGDAERGAADFVRFRCYDCHRVQGVELPPGEEPNQVVVELGVVDRPRDYGEIVTAIINPSHRLATGYTTDLVSRDGKSRMPVYNEVMTVSQLSDLVAFLQAHCDVRPHEVTSYPDYYGP